MDSPSPAIRTLARRLLSAEAAMPASEPAAPAAVRVCDKLRVLLSRFAGTDGFSALMRRALALSGDEVSTGNLLVGTDGSLRGLKEFIARAPEQGAAAAETIIANLLGLLVTFIGEPMTQRLVLDQWPNLESDEQRKGQDRGLHG